ncbi:FAD/NAD(P)-binding domain-containing protein [Stipitochalara longipes BDJ]|nr:FAD/NAD(P)-binding domain-containing protein [Stipitochalara longipes BDJ]
MRVAVIGGGPSGLVTLKTLITVHESLPGAEPIQAKLFEQEGSLGGTFKYRVYEDAELVSSRQLTTFSDYRYTPESPDFLLATEYCTYLEGYAEQFKLLPYINFSTTVTKVYPGVNGRHVVEYIQDGRAQVYTCDAVAVCSGLHVTPNIPALEGLRNVPTVIHSSEFKGRKQFGVDKDVLIVGSGETGMDIAYLAITSPTKSVTLCHRDGFLCAPKRAPQPFWFGMRPTTTPQGNVPYDVGAASLFDTAYVHPLLRDSFLPWWYYDRFAKWTTWMVSGTQAGLDQWIGEISPERFHASKIFFNKSSKAMPYISAPYRKSSLVNTLRSCIAQVPVVATGNRVIDLAPFPESISSFGTVKFLDNGRPEAEVMRIKAKTLKPDMVILATGYTQSFPFLSSNYPLPSSADIRGIWKAGQENVAFIGFLRPSFGAIPPLAELQAQLWVLNLLGHLPAPLSPQDHYKLQHPPGSRVKYGVDHESYAYQLACDMGSAASFTEVVGMGWKVAVTWALSAQVNTKFRLTGPWKWEGAKQVMETEIWQTVARRRGFFGHFTLSFMPIVLFGTLSLILYVLEHIWKTLKYLWKLITLA